MKTLFTVLAILLISVSARAQYIGNVGLQTDQEVLAPTGTTCTGSAQTYPVRNLGQASHYASLLPLGATHASMEIDGLDSSGFVYRISDVFEFAGSSSYRFGSVVGSGYFTKFQVVVTCSPNTATYTLNYSGSPIPVSINTGAFLAAQIDKVSFAGSSASSNQTDTFQTPFGSSGGTIYFQYITSSVANSNLSVYCNAVNLPGAISSVTFAVANNTNLQTFYVPPGVCPIATVGYSSGGSAATFNEEYVFSSPGSQQYQSSTAFGLSSAINNGAMLTEKGARWSVSNVPSASAQATASKAAGAVGVRHVADCVSISAGAATAPTATVLTINLRDGATGAGTVLWSTQISVAATAANHGNINFCGLNLIGTAATAMTLEFGAGLTNENESVSLTGYDVQ